MNKTIHTEKGQAIVIIALALMALFGLIGLAIDGGASYSDRRQAQNAADSGALAAAMVYAQNQGLSPEQLVTAAQDKVTANGYANVAPSNTVVVTIDDASVTDCGNIAGKFITVIIDSNKPTTFAKVIGIDTVHNTVSAKSLSCPPYPSVTYQGMAIFSTNLHKCQAIKITGTGTLHVTSSMNNGLFVNSDCKNSTYYPAPSPNSPQNALYIGSNIILDTPSISTVGGIYGVYNLSAPLPNIYTPVAPIRRFYAWPDISKEMCVDRPTVTLTAGVLTPGVYPGTNNAWKTKDFPPAGATTISNGIYCLDKDFTTLNQSSFSGTGVVFVMRKGNVNISGGNNISLKAPTSPDPYAGLLFYTPDVAHGSLFNWNPPAVTADITIVGNATSIYEGAIIDPAGVVSISGSTSTTGPMRTQVIGDLIRLSGTGDLAITYNSENPYKAVMEGMIQLIK